ATVVASASIAGAQEVEKEGASVGAEQTAEVGTPETRELTSEEQLTEAQQIEQRGSVLSRNVAKMLDTARLDKDMVRVTCLDDKLTQLNATLRTIHQRQRFLSDATSTGDANQRNHEYTVLTVLGQKLTVLQRESNQCVGQDLYET